MEDNNKRPISGKELMNLILVNCISADNNFDIESCSNSLNILNQFEESFNKGMFDKFIDIREKPYYQQKINSARDILLEDINEYSQQNDKKDIKYVLINSENWSFD